MSIVCANPFCHLSGVVSFCPLYVPIHFVISAGLYRFVHCMCPSILSSQHGCIILSIVCVNPFLKKNKTKLNALARISNYMNIGKEMANGFVSFQSEYYLLVSVFHTKLNIQPYK